jgi:8-oxo-dGTP diphosphatase
VRLIHVAVGVIIGEHKKILIAKRSVSAHQGGLWEFPGGKVEQSETLFNALRRELHEELAIDVIATEPLIKIRHDYGDKVVLLDVHKVTRFHGEPKGNEGQPIQWVNPDELHRYEFPAANRPIISAINLPQRLLITGEFTTQNDFLTRVERTLHNGIQLVQLRLANAADTLALTGAVAQLCENNSARLVVNTSLNIFLQLAPRKNMGLHLNSKNLLACNKRPLDGNILFSASCHNQFEIEHAQRIGIDFICLSPVLATKSHPEQPGMGWDAFSSLLEFSSLPTYALGGMKETDLAMAVQNGAQGIAAISEWW